MLQVVKKISNPFLIISLLIFCHSALAEVPPVPNIPASSILPGSVEPAVVSRYLTPPPAPTAAPRPKAVVENKEKPSILGPEAAKIKFKLNKIILEGNHTYSTAELSKLYKDKINKDIPVSDLGDIVEKITAYYRNNGYILSRAILPPQHVKNGEVHIRIIEGYISNVTVQGKPGISECLVLSYGKKAIRTRPLQVKKLEYYLRQANEIPGLSVRAVLTPSKTHVGASDMVLIAEQKNFDGFISWDNYGTRYLGPHQATASVTGYSIFTAGDVTRITYERTSIAKELKYVDVMHDTLLCDNGLRFIADINQSFTQPQYVLSPLDILGNATTISGTLRAPVIREADHNLYIDGGGTWIDSGVTSFSNTLYNDHLRTLFVGGSYDFADRFKGYNALSAHVEQGITGVLGATNNPFSPFISRFGADGHFTKLTGTWSHTQPFFWKFSGLFYATAQYAFNPLLAAEQFAFGGPQLGRGYDPAELIGDRGAAGSAEGRVDFAPGWFYMETFEPYLYYDIGKIFNIRNNPGTRQYQSAASTGCGVRWTLMKSHLSANLWVGQPLTKRVAAEELIGRGSRARGYFSIVGSF